MKSLNEFRTIVEEETTDYSKFDVLVRAGLANKAQISRIHRILDKMQEEKPVFNNADREIMKNLFNRMADLISGNKMIYQQARRAVREEVEEETTEAVNIKEALDIPNDPPMVLLLKRTAVRFYPNKTKVALYYNQKLDKHFSIPYGAGVDGPVQAESFDALKEFANVNSKGIVKHDDGTMTRINEETAESIVKLYESLSEENQQAMVKLISESQMGLAKVAQFASDKVE
jgi:hypothetical protein